LSPVAPTAIDCERTLTFGKESFQHVICSGPAARADLAGRFALMEADQFILVTTEGVPPDIVEFAHYCLGVSAPVTLVKVPDGEQNKNLRWIERIAVAAEKAGPSRKSVVVGLGGGMVLNMAGYFAKDWGRGDDVKVVYLPTTLLGWADMSPTRKTSVNLIDDEGKLVGRNRMGNRITPSLVWSDAGWFNSLPPVEIRSGLGEVIKALVAINPEHIPEVMPVLRKDAKYSPAELAWMGGHCVEAKDQVMEDDPDEEGRARILHSGHEFGYPAEVHLRIPHGLAISVGCLISHRVAEVLFGLDESVRELHADLLRLAGIPDRFPPDADPERLVRGLYHDSSRGILDPRDGYVDLVLLEGLGIPRLTYVPRLKSSVPLSQVPEEIALEAVRYIQAAA
jgi:3-dehydroquinate synthetase